MDQKMPDKVLSDEFMTEIGLRQNFDINQTHAAGTEKNRANKKSSSNNQVFDCDISGFNNPLE